MGRTVEGGGVDVFSYLFHFWAAVLVLVLFIYACVCCFAFYPADCSTRINCPGRQMSTFVQSAQDLRVLT
jgi:hypothetical protein